MVKGGPRRMTVVEGLYSGLGDHGQAAAAAAAQQNAVEMKMAMLVEAPAAVEDALASLLDHQDGLLQVQGTAGVAGPSCGVSSLNTGFV